MYSTIWGAISDQKGRKPTLLVMALLAALASAVFGFSSSFAMAVVIRLTVGIVSGTYVHGLCSMRMVMYRLHNYEENVSCIIMLSMMHAQYMHEHL